MSALQIIELAAGTDPQGKLIVEQLRVKVRTDNRCQLVHSPAFLQGLAGGDVIDYDPAQKRYALHKRSGNLAIQVFSRGDARLLGEKLTPEMEKLGGELDTENERMLVYSIHVSCGFNTIEALLNQFITPASQSMWRYGNVYSTSDGHTPLNWWLEFAEDH